MLVAVLAPAVTCSCLLAGLNKVPSIPAASATPKVFKTMGKAKVLTKTQKVIFGGGFGLVTGWTDVICLTKMLGDVCDVIMLRVSVEICFVWEGCVCVCGAEIQSVIASVSWSKANGFSLQ